MVIIIGLLVASLIFSFCNMLDHRQKIKELNEDIVSNDELILRQNRMLIACKGQEELLNNYRREQAILEAEISGLVKENEKLSMMYRHMLDQNYKLEVEISKINRKKNGKKDNCNIISSIEKCEPILATGNPKTSNN